MKRWTHLINSIQGMENGMTDRRTQFVLIACLMFSQWLVVTASGQSQPSPATPTSQPAVVAQVNPAMYRMCPGHVISILVWGEERFSLDQVAVDEMADAA